MSHKYGGDRLHMNPAADVLVRARNDDHLSALSPFLIDISFM